MRMVSILGDSISTYQGYNPPGYAVYYNEGYQYANNLNSVYDTWWAKVNQALGAYLCVNNSYSGSKVTGGVFPSASCYERLTGLHTNCYSPDIILIYIGFNDFGNGIKVKNNTFQSGNLSYFEDAYDFMISKIEERYPTSQIVCGTLMRTVIKNKKDWEFPERYAGIALEEYNETIRRICKRKKCFLADLAKLNIRYETLDSSHPTANGHKTIAKAWIHCLLKLGMIGY